MDVVKNEFKDHKGQMDNLRAVTNKSNSMPWTTFDDGDENCHPNLFAHQESTTKLFETNPFSESAPLYYQDQNPFWTSKA